MKLFGLVLALVAMCATSVNASLVTLDDFLSSNTTGLFGTRIVSTTGTGTASINGGVLSTTFNGGAGSVRLSYSGFSIAPSPTLQGTHIDLSNIAKAGTGVFAQLTVNGDIVGQGTVANGGVISFDVLSNLGSVTWTSAELLISRLNTNAGLNASASFGPLVATPEPASLLTAGLFSLVGGFAYRRRNKAKKTA